MNYINYIKNNNTIKFIIFIGFIIFFNLKDIKEGLTSSRKKTTIILLGDSMLNNSKYVGSGESVFDIIKNKNINILNYAVDNSKIQNINNQLSKITSIYDTPDTYIFLSVGGNDILNSQSQDEESVNQLFKNYLQVIKNIKNKFKKAKIVALNIYHPQASYYSLYYKSIDQWNKLLKQNEFEGYSVLDVDKLIVDKNDLVQDIEPSRQGSKKIADAIIKY